MEPRLIILSRAPSLYSTRRIFEEAQAAGWDVQIIDPVKLDVEVGDNGVEISYKGWPVDCDAVIPRIGHSITRIGVPVVRAFQRMGVIVLNEGNGIESSRDKLRASQMMNEGGIPIPITASVATWQGTRRAVARVGGGSLCHQDTRGNSWLRRVPSSYRTTGQTARLSDAREGAQTSRSGIHQRVTWPGYPCLCSRWEGSGVNEEEGQGQ